MKFVAQPPLRSLKLKNMVVLPPDEDEPKVHYDSSKAAKTMDKLIIDCGKFDPRCLEKLIMDLKGLRTLELARERGGRDHRDDAAGAGYQIGQLSDGMIKASKALGNLIEQPRQRSDFICLPAGPDG